MLCSFAGIPDQQRAFLTYVETVISSLNFRETGLEEFVEMVTFYVINRLRHYREEQVIDDVPQWLKSTVEKMHDVGCASESALENMVTLSAKSQELFDAGDSTILWQNANADY